VLTEVLGSRGLARRCTNQYSVLTGMDWPVIEVGAEVQRPSSPCVEKDRMKAMPTIDHH
jgi:hypothetical protein